MPTNLYGPNDNFDLLSSHVLPALLAKIDAAVRDGRETVELWGSGRPRREFLHVDDLADAVVFLMKHWSEEEPINIGTGIDVTIAALAQLIADVVGFTGRFVFDASKPDGTPRKLLDVSKLAALGWRPRIDLEVGIRQTYEWYRTSARDNAADYEFPISNLRFMRLIRDRTRYGYHRLRQRRDMPQRRRNPDHPGTPLP